MKNSSTSSKQETDPSLFVPGTYLHYKGGLYIALHLARHHDGEGHFVVYVCTKLGTINVREWDTPGKDSWLDYVEHEGKTVQRFEYRGMAV